MYVATYLRTIIAGSSDGLLSWQILIGSDRNLGKEIPM